MKQGNGIGIVMKALCELGTLEESNSKDKACWPGYSELFNQIVKSSFRRRSQRGCTATCPSRGFDASEVTFLDLGWDLRKR